MSQTGVKLALNFKYMPTSEGFLGQCVEISDIIVESTTIEDLEKDMHTATNCYFKSFPGELDKFILKDEEKFKKFEYTT